MMQLGIFAKTFLASNAKDALAAVSAATLRVAHYNMVCSGLAPMPDAIPDAVQVNLRTASLEHKVELVAISGTYNMIHPDVAVRKKGVVRLEILAAFCKCMGIPAITLCTGTRHLTDKWTFHPENNDPSAWRDLCKEMEQALQIATDYGVMLAFEPEVANVINTCQKGRRLLDEMASDHLRVVFDPANLFEIANPRQQHRLIDEGLDLLGSDLVMAHAKDRTVEGAFCAAGTGCLDYPYFLNALRSIHFDGPLVMHGLAPGEVPTSVRFLNALL